MYEDKIKKTFFEKRKHINCSGKIILLHKPIVMGVLNLTPDSFFTESRNENLAALEVNISKMLDNGAAIIDIGAYSSRPGADNVSEGEEWSRLVAALKLIQNSFPEAIISIDTFRANIAKRAVLDYGVALVNDISAGDADKDMFRTIAELNIPYIMMHMKGTPATMQKNPTYENPVLEIIEYFHRKMETLRNLGVTDILLDPGFGFGKTLQQNYTILKKLESFKIFDLPILVGLSRKSMVFKLLNNTPSRALNGTTVANTIALQNGANILRVHDVKEAVEAINMVEYLNKA